jgi:hypothetical protein
MNEQWFLRQAWRRLAGFPEEVMPPLRPDLPTLQRTEWNTEFERLMRNRLIMGAFRYGTFSEQTTRRRDNPASLENHLDAYNQTGNAEHLVDIANLALVEFTLPSHPSFHFKAIDDGQHHATVVKE